MDLVRHISFSFAINHNFVLQIRKLIIGRAINAEYRWDRFRGLLICKCSKTSRKIKMISHFTIFFGCNFFYLVIQVQDGIKTLEFPWHREVVLLSWNHLCMSGEETKTPKYTLFIFLCILYSKQRHKGRDKVPKSTFNKINSPHMSTSSSSGLSSGTCKFTGHINGKVWFAWMFQVCQLLHTCMEENLPWWLKNNFRNWDNFGWKGLLWFLWLLRSFLRLLLHLPR